MGEKVYGICGTNKCRKEVVPKENIQQLYSGLMNFEARSDGTLQAVIFLELPSGWTIEDTHILSAQCRYTGHFDEYMPMEFPGDGLTGSVRLERVALNAPANGNGVWCIVEAESNAFTIADKIEFSVLVMRYTG